MLMLYGLIVKNFSWIAFLNSLKGRLNWELSCQKSLQPYQIQCHILNHFSNFKVKKI